VGLLRGLATLLFLIALPVAFVTTNIRLAVNSAALYDYGFDKYDVELVTGIDRRELDDAAADLRSYFNDDRAVISTLVTDASGQETPLYTPREVSHLRDVKRLFQWTFRTQELTVAYAIAYVVCVVIWARELSLRALARSVMTSVLIGAGVVGGIGVFALTGFEDAWTEFHQIVFTNDFWLLDPTADRLIQMFPEGFWFDATLLIGLMTLAEAAVLFVSSAAYLFFARTRERPSPAPAGAVTSGLHLSV
jgi:integral membrane protein (TIGR01906 family)